ncbi:MAG: DUF4221 domain-containing protein [Duncaniella sp.]|nr:DUF4221 domain-containing protein [Duncaniella sp.]
MIRFFLLTSVLFTITACINQKSTENNPSSPNNGFEIQEKTIHTNPSILSLQAYALVDYCHKNNSMYAYNFKEHAIDVLDLNNDTVSQYIKLEPEGPNGIMRDIRKLQVYAPDTIIIYDFAAIKMINNNGTINFKIELPENGWNRIDRNTRSNISDFKIDFNNSSILYPIKNKEQNEIIEYNFENKKITNHFKLNNPVNNGYYGYMDFPNVKFYQNLIIYNYPFEADIYILDRINNSTRKITPKSKFTDYKTPKYEGNSDEDLNWYGAENYYHSPLYFLPGKDCFVQFTLGASSYDKSHNIDKAYHDRPIYIMTFDKNLNVIGEFEISRHKYNTFAGGFPLYDSMAFFQDNMLNKQNPEDITFDFISPI